jgi:hypothetical protein
VKRGRPPGAPASGAWRVQDEFMLTYHGEALNASMRTLVKNALQYYLALAEIETIESY